MGLKQLTLSKRLSQRKSEHEELLERGKELELRSVKLEEAIEEAETEEDLQLIEESADELTKEKDSLQEEKTKLEKVIEDIEVEIEELERSAPSNSKEETSTRSETKQLGGDFRMAHNKYETRSEMVERLNQPEVREFYATVASAAKNKRALSDTDVIIPEQVINMIQQRLGDYSSLYKEVTVQSLNGTARIIMDGAIPEAIWTEMCDPVEELASGFSQTELDGFKVGGYIPVCNALIEDSMIPLANFVEQRLAMAIANALDKAILIGEGAAQKQPLGIIPSLADEADRNVESSGELSDIVGNMSLIDQGEDGPPVGEVIAVMKRSTYYSRIAPQTFLPTSDGRLVVQTAQSPRLPDGTRIVDRKSTRLNSSHVASSYAVFCLKKKMSTRDTSH